MEQSSNTTSDSDSMYYYYYDYDNVDQPAASLAAALQETWGVLTRGRPTAPGSRATGSRAGRGVSAQAASGAASSAERITGAGSSSTGSSSLDAAGSLPALVSCPVSYVELLDVLGGCVVCSASICNACKVVMAERHMHVTAYHMYVHA